MAGLNKVQLIGRLGKDPESLTTSTGKKKASFSLAVSRRWRTGQDTKEATDWFNVDAWEGLADLAHKHLKKGRLIYVEGRLQTDRYEDKSGASRSFTKVVANTLQLLDGKPSEEPAEEMMVAEEAAEYEA